MTDSIGPARVAAEIAAVLAASQRGELRLVTYYLELALAEARRQAGQHPALWHRRVP